MHGIGTGLQQLRERPKPVVQRPVRPHHPRVDFIAKLHHGRGRTTGFQHFQGTANVTCHGFLGGFERQAFPRSGQGLTSWICPRVAEVKIKHDVHAQIVPRFSFVDHLQPRTVQPLIVPHPQTHHIHALVAHPCAGCIDGHPIVRAVHDPVVNHFRQKGSVDAPPKLSLKTTCTAHEQDQQHDS